MPAPSSSPGDDVDSPAGKDDLDGAPPPSLWHSFLHTTVPLPAVASGAILAPALVAWMLSMATPDRSWTSIIAETAGAGWVGPLMMLCGIVFARAVLEVSHRRRTKMLVRLHTMALCLLATRVRHYQSLGTGDPLTAATHDLASYVTGALPQGAAASWEVEAVRWYVTSGPWLPPIPKDVLRSVTRDAQRGSGESGVG